MGTEIPPAPQALLDTYLQALEPWKSRFYGIYIHGSIALQAFEEAESDIDIVALTQEAWRPDELTQFADMHKQLRLVHPRSASFDVAYIPLQEDAPGLSAIFRDGKFRVASAPAHMDATMKWITRHQGIRLFGPEPSASPFDVTWEDVLAVMRYNLDGYWAGKARRPHLFLFDYWVTWAVATLCRILTTIEEGEIIAKSPALQRWRDRVPERWQPLIDEAWRIRHHPDKASLYRNRIQRMRETLAFMAYVRARGGKALSLAGELL